MKLRNKFINYILSKKGMSLYQWIFLIILLSLASFFILVFTYLVLLVPVVLVNIWFYNQFYIYLTNQEINPNSEKIKNYLLDNGRMNSSLWILYAILLTVFSIFLLIFPPFVFVIPITLLNIWFYRQYNIFIKNNPTNLKTKSEIAEYDSTNISESVSEIIPDTCPHCKNPNTKKLRLCEWCGNQIY
jgi:hypothetical protein